MDKIILNDGTKLEITGSIGLELTFKKEITMNYLEEVLANENLKHVEFAKSNEDVYGKFNNLELISLSKNMRTKQITAVIQKKNEIL